jgi:hypothetical protein
LGFLRHSATTNDDIDNNGVLKRWFALFFKSTLTSNEDTYDEESNQVAMYEEQKSALLHSQRLGDCESTIMRHAT